MVAFLKNQNNYWSIISVPLGGVKLKVEAGIEAFTFTLLNFT